MIQVMVRSMLGRAGSAAMDWLIGHPIFTTAVLGLALAAYLLGRLQLTRIERRTAALVLDMSREWLRKKPNLTASGLYRRIYPVWSQSVSGWAWFIPHRWELWPVRVRPETVQRKLALSPQWIAELLARHGLSPGTQEPEENEQ
jgi:hypothetical protein